MTPYSRRSRSLVVFLHCTGIIIIRWHRYVQHKMQTTVTSVAWSVCVCWSQPPSLQKHLNWSRCCWVVDMDGPKEPCIRWEPKFPGEEAIFGGCSLHWNASDYVSRKCHNSTGQQTCPQGTACHHESEASEWTHLLHGWQVGGQCRLSSKFFHHLLTVVTLNKLFCKSGIRLLWTYNLI